MNDPEPILNTILVYQLNPQHINLTFFFLFIDEGISAILLTFIHSEPIESQTPTTPGNQPK